jgi:hypothetical protein
MVLHVKPFADRANSTGENPMSNLAHYRFQMTSSDLHDCARALHQLFGCNAEPLDAAELEGAKQLVRGCQLVLSIVAQDTEAGSEGALLNRDLSGVLVDLNATLAAAVAA